MTSSHYALYRYTERLKNWFSSRFTHAGKLCLLITGVAILFGIDIQSTMIYQIAAMVLSLVTLAFLITLRSPTHLKIDRTLPNTCVAGSELRYKIHVENQGKKNISAVFYREYPANSLPSWQEFSSMAEDGEEKRNIFDRKMGYYRWLWLLQLKLRISCYDQELPTLYPGKRQEVEVNLLPLRRGNVHVKGLALTRIDPFGLCKYQTTYESPQNLLVLPKLYPIPRLFVSGSRKYHQGGITIAENRGDSSEFQSLRDYNAGDPIKHMDWKSTARAGKPIVRQYRDEYFSRYGLVLDSFTTKSYSRIFEEAVSVAASIMTSQDSEDSVFDLLFVGSECVSCSVGRGLADQRRLMEILASVSTCGHASFSEMTGLIKSRASLLSGIIVILIDLDEQRQALLDFLAGNKIPMKVIVMVENQQEYSAKKSQLQLGIPLKEINLHRLQEDLALL